MEPKNPRRNEKVGLAEGRQHGCCDLNSSARGKILWMGNLFYFIDHFSVNQAQDGDLRPI